MAEGSAGSKPPPEIVMNDNDPKKGFCTLFLTIPGLKVQKALFGKAEPVNAKIVADIQADVVKIQVTVKTSTDSSATYIYKKNMPESIRPDKTTYKVKKELVVLSLCKESPDSWSAHQKYLLKRE